MNKLSEKIMAIVKEHNDGKKRIYWKKVTALLEDEASMPTIHKNLRQLVNNGDLVEQMETIGRGTFKFLYVPTQESVGWIDHKFDELNSKVDSLLTKADAAMKILTEPK